MGLSSPLRKAMSATRPWTWISRRARRSPWGLCSFIIPSPSFPTDAPLLGFRARGGVGDEAHRRHQEAGDEEGAGRADERIPIEAGQIGDGRRGDGEAEADGEGAIAFECGEHEDLL